MLNIKTLLKKKGWTGRDLGRLELVNTLDGFKQCLDGVQDPKPIISKAEFQKMLSTLRDPQEGRIYNGYIAIHEWFSAMYSSAVAQEQQAYLNYNILSNVITNAETAENIYSYIADLPIIMTEKQYRDLAERRKKEILHPNGEEIGFNMFNLLEQALHYYIILLQKEPRKKNPLKPLKKKLEAELVTDPRILSKYNEVMDNGYYTAPDGTRSDKVSDEEWRKIITPNDITPIEDIIKNGAESNTVTKEIARATAIYNGATEEEADTVANKKDRYYIPCEWHYYEDPPKDLNKWEILEGEELFNYYPALEGSGTDEEMLEDIKAFIKEFPTVVKALLADMDRYIKGASTMPVEEWLGNVYMWEDLYNIDYYGFKSDFVDSDSAVFMETNRILNGIAILRPFEGLYSPRIDEDTGYYKEPDIREALTGLSLESYFADSEHYAENVENIERARRLLKNSYYFLLGYNKALEITASYYDVEELNLAKIDLTELINKADAFNALVALLYKKIKETYYHNEELKQKKLETLKDVFYPISLKDITIPEEKIEKAQRDIKGFKAFTDETLDIKLTLCYPDPEENREGA